MTPGTDEKSDREPQNNLDAGTIIKKGDTEYQLIETQSLGTVATEIGDRYLSSEKVPDVGDDCIRPECNGTVKDVNGRRWCSEGCLEWMRTTPTQGDDCDKYGDTCDGQLEVTVKENGSVESECDTCSLTGMYSRVEWREAWLPNANRSADTDTDDSGVVKA